MKFWSSAVYFIFDIVSFDIRQIAAILMARRLSAR
jgi:hypothetical protein